MRKRYEARQPEQFLLTKSEQRQTKIKQVELYKRIRPYVPRKYWAKTCPAPTDEVINSVRKERANKRTTKNNNDAEKVGAKERKIVEAAEKKEKGAAARTHKKRREARGGSEL
jgi:hypothetical protein